MPIRLTTHALDRLTRDTPDRIDTLMTAVAADLQGSIIHRGYSATITASGSTHTIATDAAAAEFGTISTPAQPIVEPALWDLRKRLPARVRAALSHRR
jgi:hypothetical protein